jgi:hypothetical protein
MLVTAAAWAGGDVRDLPPRILAMGGAGSALGIGGMPMINPALLPEYGTGGEVYWMPQRFGFSELGSVAAGWAQNISESSASLSVQRFGYEMYNEHSVDASLASSIGAGLALGVRGTLHAVSIARYGSSYAAGLDIGAQIRLSESCSIGAVVWNAIQSAFAEGERLPVSVRVGAGWHSGGLQLLADAESCTRSAPTLRLGVEYGFEETVFLRLGAMTVPAMFTGGCGFAYRGYILSYAVSVHPDLGWTHMAGIGFRP